MFASLLIANRGEIAVRIIAAARTQGLRTIAIYSEADEGALHVRHADEALCVGAPSARDSYLNVEAIIAAALEAGAEAIHPGYGFLSENEDFARRVVEAGLTFVGPPPRTIGIMSDKVEARRAAIEAGVPVLDGSDNAISDVHEARAVATRIGFPIAIKASFGGGGRGIRVVDCADELEEAIAASGREAKGAFGRSEIFLERFVPCSRHVEVQVVADSHGNVIHLGDRDCSVQRRHQKLIEEAPAPDVPEEIRSSIANQSIRLAAAVGYTGVGTVEFLYDPVRREATFLEMNTRLQVEHGVTELITGIDLVELQLQIAAGERLCIVQDEVMLNGHAIQARISAEDPRHDFLPSPGRVSELRVPAMPWTRADFGIEAGDRIQPHYDPMIGKLLAWGPDRASARLRLRDAVLQLRVRGVPTTAGFAAAILDHPDFIEIRHQTDSVEHGWSSLIGRLDSISNSESCSKAEVRPERQVRLPAAGNRVVRIFGTSVSFDSTDAAAGHRDAETANAIDRRGVSAAESLASPMDATVVKMLVEPADLVDADQPLLILEAMKMEVTVRSPRAGRIARLGCASGDAIVKGQLLVELDAH